MIIEDRLLAVELLHEGNNIMTITNDHKEEEEEGPHLQEMEDITSETIDRWWFVQTKQKT